MTEFLHIELAKALINHDDWTLIENIPLWAAQRGDYDSVYGVEVGDKTEVAWGVKYPDGWNIVCVCPIGSIDTRRIMTRVEFFRTKWPVEWRFRVKSGLGWDGVKKWAPPPLLGMEPGAFVAFTRGNGAATICRVVEVDGEGAPVLVENGLLGRFPVDREAFRWFWLQKWDHGFEQLFGRHPQEFHNFRLMIMQAAKIHKRATGDVKPAKGAKRLPPVIMPGAKPQTALAAALAEIARGKAELAQLRAELAGKPLQGDSTGDLAPAVAPQEPIAPIKPRLEPEVTRSVKRPWLTIEEAYKAGKAHAESGALGFEAKDYPFENEYARGFWEQWEIIKLIG